MVRSNYYFYWREKKIKGHRFRVINKLYNKIFNPILNPKIFYILPSIWAGIYKKELIIKNNIKFLSTPGASFQDISFCYVQRSVRECLTWVILPKITYLMLQRTG